MVVIINWLSNLAFLLENIYKNLVSFYPFEAYSDYQFLSKYLFSIYYSPKHFFLYLLLMSHVRIRAASADDFFLLCVCLNLIGSLESPPSNLLKATRKPDVLVLSEIRG